MIVETLQHSGYIDRLSPGTLHSVSWLNANTISTCTTAGVTAMRLQSGQLHPNWTVDCPAWAGSTAARSQMFALATGEHIHIWVLNPLRLQKSISDSGTMVALSPDGSLLASAHKGGSEITLWDTRSASQLRTMSYGNEIVSLAWSGNGQTLAAGYRYTSETVLFDVASGHPIGLLSAPLTGERSSTAIRAISGIAFSPTDNTIALADVEGSLRLWRWRRGSQGTLIRRIAFRATLDSWGQITTDFSYDGTCIAVGTRFQTEVWSRETGEPVFSAGHGSVDLRFAPDAHMLACVKPNGEVVIWNVTTQEPLAAAVCGEPKITALAVNPRQDAVAIGRQGPIGGLTVRALSDTSPVWRAENIGHVAALAFSPDGTLLAVAGNFQDSERRLCLFDQAKQQLSTLRDDVDCIAFSPDSMRIACGGQYGFRLLDVRTLEPLRRWEQLQYLGTFDWTKALAFRGDGKLLVSGGNNGVGLWDAGRAQLIARPYEGQIEAVALSPDGRFLAAGGRDSLIIWELSGGGFLKPLTARQVTSRSDGVNALAFSPDSEILVTGGAQLRAWETRTMREVRSFQDACRVSAVGFLPESRRLVTSADAVRLWRLP